ncbi:hypothetical protein D3C73_1267000 [compost metagenome]
MLDGVEHQDDGTQLFLGQRVAPDVQAPAEQGGGDVIGPCAVSADQDRARDERIAGLVASKHNGLRQAELLGYVLPQSLTYELCVFICHLAPPTLLPEWQQHPDHLRRTRKSGPVRGGR